MGTVMSKAISVPTWRARKPKPAARQEIRDETGYSVPNGVADEIGSLVERLR